MQAVSSRTSRWLDGVGLHRAAPRPQSPPRRQGRGRTRRRWAVALDETEARQSSRWRRTRQKRVLKHTPKLELGLELGLELRGGWRRRWRRLVSLGAVSHYEARRESSPPRPPRRLSPAAQGLRERLVSPRCLTRPGRVRRECSPAARGTIALGWSHGSRSSNFPRCARSLVRKEGNWKRGEGNLSQV